MAHVTILPPRKLLHPVLPVKMNKKLVFLLCQLCAHEQNQVKCTHSDKQRELVGTWCTPELEEAKKQGYIIKKIHEIYNWEKQHSMTQIMEKTDSLQTILAGAQMKIRNLITLLHIWKRKGYS